MSHISVRSTELLSKWYGDTENTIRGIFTQARALAPCVLFFDEFDAISCKRTNPGGGNGGGNDPGGDGNDAWKNRVLSTFLNELDGICSSPPPTITTSSFTTTTFTSSTQESSWDNLSHWFPEEDCIHSSDIAITNNNPSLHTVLVIVACQDIHKMDDALLRPGMYNVHV